MGKQGPCRHCGVTSTPLWRNGPPEKPVLCNACGSRWRTKGSLANYTPLRVRSDHDEIEDEYRVSRVTSIAIKNKGGAKRKQNHENGGVISLDFDLGFRKVLDEDTSNRSSSGSAISNSESCVQFGSGDAGDLTGPTQSIVWDTMVPSRKRTCVTRPKPSPVEKLAKDLCSILHEQQSSYFSGSSEEDLLFENEKPMVSVEIGHGSVLIRHPNSIARDEESEASSLSFENKQQPPNEAYSRLSKNSDFDGQNKGVTLSGLGFGKIKKPNVTWMEQEQIKRDKAHQEKLQILESHNSPLCHVDLKDIVNYELLRYLTADEQQQLLKYLPSVDTSRLPGSLVSMFDSPRLAENLSSFQKLLEVGVFDLSLSGVPVEDCKSLKRLVLCNSTKSNWVEQYNRLEDLKSKNSSSESVVGGGLTAISSDHSVNVKRSRDGQYQNCPGAKGIMKCPKRVIVKNDHEIFNLLPDNILDSLHFGGENSDNDLLLEVPSNGFFPQAELLPTSSCSIRPNPFLPG